MSSVILGRSGCGVTEPLQLLRDDETILEYFYKRAGGRLVMVIHQDVEELFLRVCVVYATILFSPVVIDQTTVLFHID